MSKRYKIWMFILAGIGALMLIGGLSSFGESVGLAIFGIIGGLIVALPMLLLYKPLSEKKKEEEREKQRKEEKARRAEEEKKQLEKEAAEREKQRKKEEWERTHSRMQVWLDEVYQSKAEKAMKKVDDDNTIVYTTLKRFKKGEEWRLAVIIDDEKIGEIIADAETVSQKWHNSQRAYFSPIFIKDFNAQTGEMEIAVRLDITFTLSA